MGRISEIFIEHGPTVLPVAVGGLFVIGWALYHDAAAHQVWDNYWNSNAETTPLQADLPIETLPQEDGFHWPWNKSEELDPTPEPQPYPDEGGLDTFTVSESAETQPGPGIRETNSGDYSITTSDGTVWSCGTLYNSDHTDHVLNIPEAWFPVDIFKRLDFDGFLEGPYIIDFHVRQEKVDTLDAEVMHRAASGAGVCIQESMTVGN